MLCITETWPGMLKVSNDTLSKGFFKPSTWLQHSNYAKLCDNFPESLTAMENLKIHSTEL